jgi:hypothetical protein
VDYGTDINILVSTGVANRYTVGLDPTFRLISGTMVLLQAAIKRLTTPAGSLAGDPEYGYDLRAYLNRTLQPGEFESIGPRARKQLLLDERIKDATVLVTYTESISTLRVAITLTPASGATPFPLTLELTPTTAPTVITSVQFSEAA